MQQEHAEFSEVSSLTLLRKANNSNISSAVILYSWGRRAHQRHRRQLKFWALSFAVMQDSPRVGVRWSIIILNGLSYKDAGEYRCQARNLAGISEALIKLKVVGVTGLPRLPKRKPVKTGSRPSWKYRKPLKTTSFTVKEKQRSPNITSSYLNREQMLTF